MSTVPMQKVAVVAHRSQKERVIELLHQEGIMEVSDARDVTNVDHPAVPYRSGELEHVIARLTEVASKQVLTDASKIVPEDAILQAALHSPIRKIIDQVHALEEAHGSLTRALHDLEYGRLPVEHSQAEANAADEGAYFTSRVHEDLSHFGTAALSPSELEEVIASKKAETERELQQNHAALVELSEHLPTLVRARRYIHWLDEQESVRQAMTQTASTVTLFGWIAAHLFEPLERSLHKISPATALLKIEPHAGEQAPVLLRNWILMKPFESVTTLYGLPQSHEFDPTPLLAPFFILFFGLCLTDAGYGLVLAGVMAAFLAYKRLSIQQATLWWLLLFGGIFTFLVAIPFGGWFGFSPDQAPAFMTELRADGRLWFKGQIWNLGETPGITFFQNLSIVLGLIHLSFGIFLGGLSKWVNGRKAEGFWVDWTTLLLFAAVGACFLAPVEYRQHSLIAMAVTAVMVLWGKGYGSRWYVRPLTGMLGVLNLAMGMMSNTLSYLRLLALGLATGALALAVNLVAQQIGGMLPLAIGIPVSIIIYIAGHTLNIALNVLGAFIHSGRLQFVEFFSQFFEGGGRPLEPFRRSYA